MAGPSDARELLGSEWACLAALAERPAHGFAVAARLAPTGDLGRARPVGRPLTYRALEQLTARGLVEVVGEERGRNGQRRVVLAATVAGRAALAGWLEVPVADVVADGDDLLLKLVVLDLLGLDAGPLARAQLALLGAPPADRGDVVDRWRAESVAAIRRVLVALASHDDSPA